MVGNDSGGRLFMTLPYPSVAPARAPSPHRTQSIKYELGKGSTIGASNSGGKDTENINGIVQGEGGALAGAGWWYSKEHGSAREQNDIH